MATRLMSSWGNTVREEHEVLFLSSRFAAFPSLPHACKVLPYGNGRSYGDCCLNFGGALLEMRGLNRFMHFDATTGLLGCEAGTLLGEILDLVVPRGWFLPVVPGTQYVTVGGAIANDVHGKNHHRAGTFGRHVRELELLRSNNERMQCAPDRNGDLFAATIGGMGLTGAITHAAVQLQRVAGPWVDVEAIRFNNLDGFFDLSRESDRDFEYTVAWIDCLARGSRLGRGIFQRANHTEVQHAAPAKAKLPIRIPFTPPLSLVNAISLRVFNEAYFHLRGASQRRDCVHYRAFFFPLDGVSEWNRLYGPRGFHQYQCVVPAATAQEVTRDLLRVISKSGQGSFLAVLKQCGALRSPGKLSFPMLGTTLALDFPNRGGASARLFAELDAIVSAAGGRLYPAKDMNMPSALFCAGYPQWREFAKFVDPRFSSSLWRRVTNAESA